MLQDSLRCYRGGGRGVCGDSGPGRGVGIWPPGAGWGFGPRRGVGWDSDPGCGVGWGFRPERGVGWGFGPGAGWSGDSDPSAGWGGDSDPGAGWSGDSGPGAGWRFGPRRGVEIRARVRGGVEIRAPARGGVGIRTPGAGWGGDFWGKMGNFLPFCRFFAVWVEICGNRKLVSLPFRRFFCCLGRDFRTAELGISTFFQQKPLFR